MGRTVGFGHSTMGHLGHVWWSRDSGMGRTGGFGHSTMGHLGHVWDIPSSPGALGWDGQWDLGTLPLDTWDMSGISQVVPGLWDGMDSGIWALHYGTLGTCLGYPK